MAMVGTLLVLGFLLVASYTDVRWRLVHNRTTYTGVLTAVCASGLATWFGVDLSSAVPATAATWGIPSLADSLLGCLVCGLAMLVCYVLFAGGVGGGDLKLMAMIGAFLGLYQGLEALLWTMILGGVLAIVLLIWRVGAWQLTRAAIRGAWAAGRGQLPDWTNEEWAALRTELFLSPSALLAVLVVRFNLASW
ncbi:MAG: prepilin peptidase [Planctomycetota bacterium]